MPVDLRYHVASLLAVFCALLIGILLGIGLVGDPKLEGEARTFRRQANRYEDRINELRRSVAESTQREQQYRAFEKQILPQLIHGRLNGVRIAMILNRDLSNTPWVEALRTAINEAGGEVASTTAIRPRFLELSTSDAVGIFHDFDFPVPLELNDQRSMLAGKLAVRIAEGSSSLIFRLRQLGLIRVDGDYERPVDAVVLVGGTDSDRSSVNVVDLPLIRALQEAGKRVIACEATVNRLSCMYAYQRRPMPTVDNADTAAGQLAVILVLAGANGDFGVKNTADQLLPPLSPSGG